MENGASSEGKDPSTFLGEIIGSPVVVKLNSGVVYEGELQSVDGYMNIALEKTEEYVNGQLRRSYGDAFVRGNNGGLYCGVAMGSVTPPQPENLPDRFLVAVTIQRLFLTPCFLFEHQLQDDFRAERDHRIRGFLGVAMSLQAIKYDGKQLLIIDQLQLPFVEEYVNIQSTKDGWDAIKEMRVRGAPAIAIVAILSLAIELRAFLADKKPSPTPVDVGSFIIEKLHYLVTSRPTAVNLGDAARKFESMVNKQVAGEGATGESVASAYFQEAEKMLASDLSDNQNIGAHGAKWILEKTGETTVNVLTHCNTGSLATSGYGTALGVIRSLHSGNALGRAYCTETRPYNQGARLTAFELVHDKIPATLITDSMASALMNDPKAKLSAIVVGADRVAANGDTANKIGTYGLAVLAKYHGVKFLVAAPRTTIDRATKTGADITIEERAPSEVTVIKGPLQRPTAEALQMETVKVAAPGIDVWNPAFDVTPAALIDGVITEKGVVEKGSDGFFHFDSLFDEEA
ncbi:Methylthioribose-1-phosphate isomerase [Talaromyces islandicus]|uniref:Methylthioribose-1-phosphate isomerase n=1 Tax=Talaromyces islandicus TaxID=28573 RepID=A0A0U1LWW7_TALIS|nr:Methylthioribose-1-phosphate isomerase [Talaromyces islandicus]